MKKTITMVLFTAALFANATSKASEFPKIKEYDQGQRDKLAQCYKKHNMECIADHYKIFEARQEAFNQKQYGKDFQQSVAEYLEMQYDLITHPAGRY